MKKENCYFCQNKKLEVVRKKIRDATRDVLRCTNPKCNLVFLKSRKENLREYYKRSYRKFSSPVIGNPLNSKQIFNLHYPLQGNRIEKIKKHLRLNKGKRVLDIGCSTGHLLYAIKPYVKECVGIELNEDNVKFANNKLKIKVYNKPVEETDLPKKYFDVIFCFQALEHMPDPIRFLKTIKEYLKDGGEIYMEVPNINEASLSIYNIKEYEDFYYHKPHLFYYSPETLADLMKKAGYKGKVLPFQWYNFLNQMNWLLAKKPQNNMREGISDSILTNNKNVPKKIRNDFNKWIKQKDKEYKKLVEKYMISDQIIFIGKKK